MRALTPNETDNIGFVLLIWNPLFKINIQSAHISILVIIIIGKDWKAKDQRRV